MNEANFTRLIERVRAEGKHFKMALWTNADHDSLVAGGCGTAACLGGWVEALTRIDIAAGLHTPTVECTYDVAGWLGMTETEYFRFANLFVINDSNPERNSVHLSMDLFDTVLSPEERSAAGVRVLEIFRETGKADWPRALKELNFFDRVARPSDY